VDIPAEESFANDDWTDRGLALASQPLFYWLAAAVTLHEENDDGASRHRFEFLSMGSSATRYTSELSLSILVLSSEKDVGLAVLDLTLLRMF
jgi:hypothetical protein